MLSFSFNLNGSEPTANSASEKVNKLYISEPFSWLDFFSSPHQSSYVKCFPFINIALIFSPCNATKLMKNFISKKKL